MNRLALLLPLLLSVEVHAQAVRPIPRPAPRPSMTQTGVVMPEVLPATPTGAGLATVGPPDALQVVRRSEGRLLPQTPEPGLWSAEKAVRRESSDYYGHEFPLLAGMPLASAEQMANTCKRNLVKLMDRAPLALKQAYASAKDGTGKTSTRTACLAARFYALCVEDAFSIRTFRTDYLEPYANQAIPGEDRGGWDRKKAVSAAQKNAREKCREGNLPEVDALVEWIRSHLEQTR